MKSKPYRMIKRLFDIAASSILLIILLPMNTVVAAAIKLNSSGPVFYIHERVGKDFATLRLLKFRTMYTGADEEIQNFSEDEMAEWEKNYKLENDRRVTGLGRILRKASIDEIPQLINIVKGEMSIVGPRPVTKEEVEKYGTAAGKFLSVLPGLTGYWQAYARNTCSYEKRMQMELFYVENASLTLDIRILIRTVFRVISQKGAM